MAMVGAYVLIGEPAAHDDPGAASTACGRLVRLYMEADQALAVRGSA